MVTSVQKVYGRRRSSSSREAISMEFSTTSQTRLPPMKRTTRPKRSAWSAPSRRQQTITQMNPFLAIYHPEDTEDNLQYLDDDFDLYQESPRHSKRRKVFEDDTPTQPMRTRVTRSTAVEATEKAVRMMEEEGNLPKHYSNRHHDEHLDSKLMPPPPKTPRARRTEIPSSQSPIDTPLSTRSIGRLRQDAGRSPLKERSLNALMRQNSSGKISRQGTSVREIADSMEDEEENSLIAVRNSGSSLRTQKSAESIYEEISALRTPTKKTPKRDNRSLDADIQPLPQEPKSPELYAASDKASKKIEILDSDAEDDNDEDISTASRNHAILQSQPNTDDAAAILIKKSQQRSTAAISSTASDEILKRRPQTLLDPRRAPQYQPTIDVPSSQPEPDDSPPRKSHSPINHSASQQLHRELTHYTDPPTQVGLTTESQYEKGWKSYHPPPSNPTLPPSSSALQPLSPLQSPHPQDDQSFKTIPTQDLFTIKPTKRPIPPSQATTVDTTQTQPSQIPSSPARQQSSSPPPPPAPPALFSSSPLMSRPGVSQWGARGAYEWDGRVLTDSQLLPASLMEDSLGLGGGVGEWRGEEEEEED